MAAIAETRQAGVSGRSGKTAEQSFKGRPIFRPRAPKLGLSHVTAVLRYILSPHSDTMIDSKKFEINEISTLRIAP